MSTTEANGVRNPTTAGSLMRIAATHSWGLGTVKATTERSEINSFFDCMCFLKRCT